MLRLVELIRRAGLSQRRFAEAVQLSPAAVTQMVRHYSLPRSLSADELDVRVRTALVGIPESDIDGWDRPIPSTPADSGDVHSTDDDEDMTMLLRYTALSPDARAFYGLGSDPFHNEIRSSNDLYLTPPARMVRETMWQTARNGGFFAVVGESGAGKSVLRQDLEDRIDKSTESIQLIKPYVLGMEADDKRGKTLRASHIAEAIINGLEPRAKLRQSAEGRFRQVEQTLREARRADIRMALCVEEAHSIPTATLKHMKRFNEMTEGFQSLITIIMIGQPELRDRLSETDPTVREVTQRCEVVELPPLDAHLGGYLDHKFRRAGAERASMLTDDALDAIRVRLHNVDTRVRGRHRRAESLLYPLAVGNLVNAALNAAAAIQIGPATAEVVEQL